MQVDGDGRPIVGGRPPAHVARDARPPRPGLSPCRRRSRLPPCPARNDDARQPAPTP
jgi:hypothetical protein